MTEFFYRYPSGLFALVILALMILAIEAGYRIGRRLRRLLEAGKRGRATDLIRVNGRTRKVTLALGGGTLRKLNVHFIAVEEALPLSAVGVVLTCRS